MSEPATEQAATPLARLPWQANTVRAWLARRDTWPHATLLQGAAGLGKSTLARHLARALLCETQAEGGEACGTCAACRYVDAGQHPDLRLIEPVEVNDDGEVKRLTEIPVRHIRSLTAFTQVTSHRRIAKVAIIAPAEAMNAEAANALLKTLEEPPPSTYLLLVSHQPGRLPATVRSRCALLDAPRPTPAQAIAWLEQQGVESAAHVLAQANGAPVLARELAAPVWQRERAAWLDALSRPRSLAAVALASRIDAAPKDERRDRLALAIDWIGAWVTDLARVAAGAAPLRNVDFQPALSALSARVAPLSLFRYHRSLMLQRALVAHPLQPRLVAESLLFAYRELFD